MNIKMTSVALALIATSAAAFAADEFVEHTNFTSSRTRAQVQAELNDTLAQNQGAMRQEFVEHQPLVAGKTRAEVRAELEAAYAQGALTHAPEFVEHAYAASTRSREEVRNEAIQAAKAGRDATSRYGS